MAIEDITPTAVADAVRDGADNVRDLAKFFGCSHVAYTLRQAVYKAACDGLIVEAGQTPQGTPKFADNR